MTSLIEHNISYAYGIAMVNYTMIRFVLWSLVEFLDFIYVSPGVTQYQPFYGNYVYVMYVIIWVYWASFSQWNSLLNTWLISHH